MLQDIQRNADAFAIANNLPATQLPQPAAIFALALVDRNGNPALSRLDGGAEILAAARTVTPAESGKVFYLNLAGGFTVTLPAPALGLRYEFIVKTAPTTAYIILAAPTDIIIGYPVASTGGDESANGNVLGDQVNFVANTALASDRLVLTCDGTYWYAVPTCKATGAITITG